MIIQLKKLRIEPHLFIALAIAILVIGALGYLGYHLEQSTRNGLVITMPGSARKMSKPSPTHSATTNAVQPSGSGGDKTTSIKGGTSGEATSIGAGSGSGGSGPTPIFTHDYVQDFNTNVSAWPSNGSAATGYGSSGVNIGGFCAYADGTSGKYYPSKVISVHDGMMDYYNHSSMAAAILPFCYTGFTYGTWSVSMKQGGVFSGYHNAFLLWPNSGKWPADGEFDFPENETSAAKPYVAVVQSDASFLPKPIVYTPFSWNDGAWHIYTMQWGPGFLRTYQDGILVATVTSDIPSTPMHPVLQNEFSNTLKDPAKPDPSLSGHVYVDRITYDKSYTVPTSDF